ncbi:3470_t:CDS:2 [Gigaspora margarita]|uniref:3470_t:CDS:1 n=1 Tax=Gigaspora margarita TaxID=4874 RepID=A0ABN7V1W7_GIGMA|nr:3470_t:CDS:2 [Gigaspora margarita]
MLDDKVLLAFSSNTLNNGNKILLAFDFYILDNKILLTSGSYVLSDKKLSENTLNNNNASDINKQQNIKFNNQKKLEIAPGLKFQTWDQLNYLSATIQSFKQQNKIINEASTLLETLFNNRPQDPNLLLESTSYQPHILITDSNIANEATIENIMPEIYRINCIYHISQNLIKNLKSKLESDWDEFTARVQSIQCVEGINRIVKSNLTNKTSLSKFASVLNSQLAQESMYIHYKFLTPSILSLQRVEIAEAFWYSAILVSKESVNINLLQEKNEIGFYEDLDNFPATKIDEVITNLSTFIYSGLLESQPLIIYKNSSAILTFNFMSNLTLIYPSFSNSFNVSRTLNTHHTYGITNSLYKKAMTIGLDTRFTQWKHLISF